MDHRPMPVGALTPSDGRVYTVEVGSPAALIVAKLHKLGDRKEQPVRLADKDAHDVYRLLAALPLDRFVASLIRLTEDELAGQTTRQALHYLQQLFAEGPEALGAMMAGRAEEGIGDPDVASASVAALSQDLLAAVQQGGPGAGS